MGSLLALEILFAPIRLVALALVSASLTFGQGSAELGGTVTDAVQKAAVSGATVTVTRTDTGAEKKAVTDDQGMYVVSGLQPGAYEIQLRKEGFQTVVRGDVKLQAGEKIQLDFEMSLGETAQAVTVTAEKRTERIQDVPVPVSVVNTQDLAENGQTLLRDFYNTVPGLSLSPNENGIQNLSIRGITQGGFASPTVGYLVDDVPFSSLHNWLPEVDPGDLEQIEVLRGPQGTLYGASSMGGLVKVVTKDPSTDKLSGDVEVSGSSVQNGAEPGYNFRGAINVPLSNTWAVRASGFKRQDSGYIDNPALHINGINEMQAYGGRLASLWQPSEKFSISLKALYQHTAAAGSSEVDELPGLGDLQQSLPAGIGGETRTIQAYSASIKARLRGIDLTSITGYVINRFNSSYYYGSSFDAPVRTYFGQPAAVGPIFSVFEDKTFTQEIRASGSITPKLEFLVSGYYSHENSPQRQILQAQDPLSGQIYGIGAVFNQSSQFEEYAVFGDLTYHFTDRFDIQVGGREAHINPTTPELITTLLYAADSPPTSTKSNPFTYLATPQFKVTTDLMVYARLASGYRTGKGTDNPAPTALCVEQNFQCAVKPDKTYSYEVGAKGDFLDHKLSPELSFYYIDWSNIQLSLRTPGGFVYQGNGAGAKSEGTEVSVSSTPLEGLHVTGWVSYDDALMTKPFALGRPGDRLPYTSKWSANLSFRQEFPLWSGVIGFIGAQVSYVGDRIGLFTKVGTGPGPRQYLPDYTSLGLRAGVRWDAWAVNAYVNNATNARGLLNGGIGYSNPVAFQYIVPRTVGMSVTRSF